MQPGDRQEVRQAGIAERLDDLLVDRAALAGDEGRGDPAGRPGSTAVIRRVTSVRSRSSHCRQPAGAPVFSARRCAPP
jgi:hypothetical protein